MRKALYLSLGLVAIVVGSFSMVWFHAASQDTTLMSYLSGVLAVTTGGSGEDQLIRVNLHNGSLALFNNGHLDLMAKVAGTGNPNDSTATPTGEFRILSKEPSHTSRLSGVIMPWAMRFYEGYYFHDIPLTPGGVIINTRYSHGCIRLPTSLVKQVYDWTRIGAHVEVYRADLVKDNVSPIIYYLTESGLRQPIANAEAFIAHGYQWDKVVTIPSAELESLPLGTTII